MPQLVPVYNQEKSLKEQDDTELIKHRNWDFAHSLVKLKKRGPADDGDAHDSSVHLRKSNNLMKNEKGLWVPKKGIASEDKTTNDKKREKKGESENKKKEHIRKKRNKSSSQSSSDDSRVSKSPTPSRESSQKKRRRKRSARSTSIRKGASRDSSSAPSQESSNTSQTIDSQLSERTNRTGSRESGTKRSSRKKREERKKKIHKKSKRGKRDDDDDDYDSYDDGRAKEYKKEAKEAKKAKKHRTEGKKKNKSKGDNNASEEDDTHDAQKGGENTNSPKKKNSCEHSDVDANEKESISSDSDLSKLQYIDVSEKVKRSSDKYDTRGSEDSQSDDGNREHKGDNRVNRWEDRHARTHGHRGGGRYEHTHHLGRSSDSSKERAWEGGKSSRYESHRYHHRKDDDDGREGSIQYRRNYRHMDKHRDPYRERHRDRDWDRDGGRKRKELNFSDEENEANYNHNRKYHRRHYSHPNDADDQGYHHGQNSHLNKWDGHGWSENRRGRYRRTELRDNCHYERVEEIKNKNISHFDQSEDKVEDTNDKRSDVKTEKGTKLGSAEMSDSDEDEILETKTVEEIDRKLKEKLEEEKIMESLGLPLGFV
ncbi:hypothetical protein C922_01351 [Plasmodium inui San Antonio 1]|uniref:Uncharacterized protein n=1 Tax=Plasmodium inui San Antonio 1 TaxID=1237626 RepID=W7AS72_9APIC|nr:hypothetical protein C922_01351 [Plasmodium inui San Antonio 1]EUD68331.1 hypothetical protein C922_01351 [Plasmodium inui San Antonio 1]